MGRRIQITESQLRYIIENVNRLDEQVEEENLPTVNFGKSFKNNMVSIDSSNSDLQTSIKELDGYITQAKEEGKKLKSIDITINAGASEARATNRLPEGVDKPDHNYGGMVPSNMWTNVNKRVQSAAITKLPTNYNPSQGYFAIKDGNKFLAQKRAENLQKYLNDYLNKKYSGAKIKVKVVGVNETNKKFVEAIIDSIVFELPTINPYKYQIIYDWYQIGNSDTPYVLINDTKSYDSKLQTRYYGRGITNVRKDFVEAVKNSEDDVVIAGYVKKGSGNNIEYRFFSFGAFNKFVSREGSVFYYDDAKSWMEDLKKINSMNPAKEFTMRKGDVNSKEKVNGVGAKGYWDPGKGGVANFHHGMGQMPENNKITIVKPFNSDGKVVTIKQVSQGIPKTNKPKSDKSSF